MEIRIGDLLVQKGLVTKLQLKKALQAQRLYGGKLGTNFVELGFISDTDLANVLSQQLNLPPATVNDFEGIPRPVLDLVDKSFAAEHKLIPLKVDQKIKVAICDPTDLKAIDELGFKLGKGINVVIAPEIWIVAALERFYGIQRKVRYIQIDESDDNFVGEITNNLSDMIEMNNEYEEEEIEPEGAVPMAQYAEDILWAQSAEDIFNILFGYLTPFFPQMALYAVRKDKIQGALLSGFPVHVSQFLQSGAEISPNNTAGVVASSGQEYRGPLPETPGNKQLFGQLAIEANKAIGLYPINFRGKVISVLLGVPEKNLGPPIPDAGQIVSEALSRAGMALEILYLKRRVRTVPAKPGSKEK